MTTRTKLTIKERLLKNRIIDEKTGCWLYALKSKSRANGHAKMKINGKKQFVHRVAWQEFVGPIVNLILHKQICPNKTCFNPEHLYDGTQKDNVRDSMEMGTYVHPRDKRKAV